MEPNRSPTTSGPPGVPRRRRGATRRIRTARRLAGPAAAACLVLGACRSRKLVFHELEAANRSLGVETLVYEPTFSLYSPYSPGGTESYALLVRIHLQAIATLFRVEIETPVIVWLQPDAGVGVELHVEGDVFHVRPPEAPPPAFLGHAWRDWAFVRVGMPTTLVREDGLLIKGSYAASLYLPTIRHELAHAVSFRAGLSSERWFQEGVAGAVASMELEDGTLVLGDPPAALRELAARPRSERGLADLLAWGPPRDPLPPGEGLRYSLAHAYVRFLLDGTPPEAFVPTLRAAAAASRDEHLARETAWWEWTEALAREDAADDAP